MIIKFTFLPSIFNVNIIIFKTCNIPCDHNVARVHTDLFAFISNDSFTTIPSKTKLSATLYKAANNVSPYLLLFMC
jgi:hypothetical protein